eukprot:4304997-Alexandrium_andersonii.AAC.1
MTHGAFEQWYSREYQSNGQVFSDRDLTKELDWNVSIGFFRLCQEEVAEGMPFDSVLEVRTGHKVRLPNGMKVQPSDLGQSWAIEGNELEFEAKLVDEEHGYSLNLAKLFKKEVLGSEHGLVHSLVFQVSHIEAGSCN